MIRADVEQPLRLLVLSSLYPNSVQPRHGVFVEERLRSLVDSGAVTACVVAPVPWFPFKHHRFGRYADFARVPSREVRHGIEVLHPRYPVIPRMGMTLGPIAMATRVAFSVKRMLAEGRDFDLIDAHYFYPDGVAASKLGRRFGRPVVITARGSDINEIAGFRVPRRQILDAAHEAAAVVAVSQALKETLVEMGVDSGQITPLRNGVDLNRFAPVNRATARAHIGCVSASTERVWLAVGHLLENKGVHITIEALAQVSDAILLVVGTGPEEANLRRLASRCGVEDRVHFVGHVEHDDLPAYYSAANALVFPSGSEGMPNVVLEAMACGTPVVATAVGGIPELVTAPEAGRLMAERTPAALVAAVSDLMQHDPVRQATRAHANRFNWEETTQGQLALFRRIVSDQRMARALGHPRSEPQ